MYTYPHCSQYISEGEEEGEAYCLPSDKQSYPDPLEATADWHSNHTPPPKQDGGPCELCTCIHNTLLEPGALPHKIT